MCNEHSSAPTTGDVTSVIRESLRCVAVTMFLLSSRCDRKSMCNSSCVALRCVATRVQIICTFCCRGDGLWITPSELAFLFFCFSLKLSCLTIPFSLPVYVHILYSLPGRNVTQAKYCEPGLAAAQVHLWVLCSEILQYTLLQVLTLYMKHTTKECIRVMTNIVHISFIHF